MVYWVYVLESLKGGHRYVGSTHDVQHRLDQHNAGRVPPTKERRPWKVIYKEEHPTRTSANRKETLLKTGRGKDFLKAFLKKQHAT